MKLVFDPFQALASSVTGIVTRGLIAWAVMVAGSALASYPEVRIRNVLMLFGAPAFLFLLTFVLGLTTFGLMVVAWLAFISYFRFTGGKWTLFLLFSSSCYGTAFAFSCYYSYPLPPKFWSDHAWAFSIPVFAGSLIAIPELVDCYRRKAARS